MDPITILEFILETVIPNSFTQAEVTLSFDTTIYQVSKNVD